MKLFIPNILSCSKVTLRMVCIMFGLLMLFNQEANATHIVGGNITYRCLGNNQYEIRLSLRRDCLLGAPDAQFDDPASIGFFDATTNQPLIFVGFGGQLFMDFNGSDTLNEIFTSDCGVIGAPVCVHQTTYVDTIFLPYWANGYKMVYQRCCRNGSVNNILNPVNTGMTLETDMTGAAQLVCKSSPQLLTYPPIYICVNKEIDFIPEHFDSDGDSIGFSLATPWAGGDIINNRPQPPGGPPYELVNWRPPYSLANIMGGVPLTIHPVTGRVTGKPNTIGQFVLTIVITSYRNGVPLSYTRVDFQYNVRDCRPVPIADFTSPGLNCNGLTMNFTNQSEMADSYIWTFDTDDPNSDTSTETNPVHTYDEEGFYNVSLVAYDSNMICYDTIVKQIGVFFSDIQADFSYSSNSCTDGVVLDVTDLSTSSNYPIAEWNWLLTYGANVEASTDTNPVFNLDIDGMESAFLVLIVTDINGCTDSKAQSFQVKEFGIEFNPDADSICKGESVHLLLNGDPSLQYTWSPPNGLDITDPWDPIAFPGISVEYFVTVTDGVCTLTDSIEVNVQQPPNLQFTYDTDCRDLVVDFFNTSPSNFQYHWDFGDTARIDDTSSVYSPSWTYDSAGVYVVTLTVKDGCDFFITDTITANGVVINLAETLVNCFESSIELNPDFNPDYIYTWTPAEFLDDPSSPNPVATVDNDTWFFVTVMDPNFPECIAKDSVLVIIPDDFEISVSPEDTISCAYNDILLIAEVTGNQNVSYVWKDIDGNILETGQTLIVNPIVTTVYIAMAMDTLGCSKADTVTIFKPDPEFELDAGNDSIYCYIQTITLCATSIDGVTYEWFNADGDLIGTSKCIDVTPGSATCYAVIGTDALGCQESDLVCLTPVYFQINAGPDQSICLGDSATLTVTGMTGLTYEWFDENDILVGTGEQIKVSPEESTCYYAVGTDALGCQDADTVCIDPFIFDISIAGDNVVCFGDEVTLEVTDANGLNLTYIWSPGGETTAIIVVSPEVTTNYSVTVTDADSGCLDSISYLVEVIGFNPLDIVITADPDSIILGESSQLTVNQDPAFDYVWSASTGELVDPIYNPVVTPTGPTTYCVTVTDFDGCTGVACTSSPGVADPFCDERDVFIPNAFSPNDDNYNDVLCVRSNFVESMELHIYSRWGEEVFSSKDINSCWDGRYNGQLLPPDVFGYYLNVTCPNGKSYFKKGNITLLH